MTNSGIIQQYCSICKRYFPAKDIERHRKKHLRHVRVKFIQDSPAFIDMDFKVIRNPREGIKKGDILVISYAYALVLNELKMISQTFLEEID